MSYQPMGVIKSALDTLNSIADQIRSYSWAMNILSSIRGTAWDIRVTPLSLPTLASVTTVSTVTSLTTCVTVNTLLNQTSLWNWRADWLVAAQTNTNAYLCNRSNISL